MEDYASSDEDYYNQYEADDLVDYDDGDPDIDYTVASLNLGCSSSKVITQESLLAAQREDLHRVMDMLSLKEHHARTLLIHYRWDVEKVLALLVEKGKDELYAEAGVTVVKCDEFFLSKISSIITCNICMEEVSRKEVTLMDCGHYFCNTCWTEHFIVKINEGQSRRIKCMAYKCNAVCDEAKIRKLVGARDPYLAEKFDRFLLESFIEDNKRVKWCPSIPNCGNAIYVEGDELCEVECACGLQFCFSCSSEVHSPCSCLMWELWSRKCKDNSETVNWLTAHTKFCPNCLKPVEKSGGCNLVVCICGQGFCWLCGGATGWTHTWQSIADHSCGRYKDLEMKAARAKRDLVRYMHYHGRYKAHTDSFKLESNLKTISEGKISLIEGRNSTFKDFGWVTNGLYRLSRSRQILSYSYPFAFYMFGDLFEEEMTEKERELKQNLFEDQQQQLEANVEKLSSYIEEPFDEYTEDRVDELRLKIMDLSAITEKLCLKLYECIENDLLASLHHATHHIAPYMSKGAERARGMPS
ncbi:RBR-type E3 ubiquitin transferase [Quillaja saponaria]|uniref:RBR-type E3 ubiquitin transferase n=1 Tax=Quillaja saponaria TaxID=32244 RepID=A0AAD7PK40_QUISA|nr:RBR-type E3 ubiquitin transferase [Quillaja saponaria]